MILVNIPCLVAQVILYFARNVEMLYASSSLMALSIGFLNAPSLGYTGEVCEPKLRGILTSSMNIFYFTGTIILTMMYSITNQWRLTVLVTTVFPILTIIILLTVILYAIDIAGGLNDNQPKCMICFRHQIHRCGYWPRESIQKHTETSAGWGEKYRTKNARLNFKKWLNTMCPLKVTNRVISLIILCCRHAYIILFYSILFMYYNTSSHFYRSYK